jgi:membrane-anchored glycerophosphoryl diester phosphodiesterase (GDPDase)
MAASIDVGTGSERRYSFVDAIAVTFSTAVRHWRTCIAISALYAGLLGVAYAVSRTSSGVVDPSTLTPSEVVTAGIAAIAVLTMIVLIYVFVGPVTLGALSLVGSAAIYGDTIDTRGIIRRAFDRSLEAIGATILTVVALAIPPFVVGMIAFVVYVASRLAGFAVLIFGLVLLAAPLIYVAVRLSLALPVVMREGRGPVDALRRSWALVRGAWWWVFAVEAFAWAILLATGMAQYASLVGSDTRVDFLVGAVTTAVAVAIATILYGVALGVVYAARVPEDVVPPEVARAEQRVLDPQIDALQPEKPILGEPVAEPPTQVNPLGE